MDLGLAGKSAIVTGGSRGIGLAIAETFAREGANVSICARDTAHLQSASEAIGAHGGVVHAASCDVASPTALDSYMQQAHTALGGLDILVNNASAFGRSDDEHGWRASIDVDLMASVRASWAATPMLEAAGGGAIVHISSISGFGASTRTPPYAAIKATLMQYTQTQALDLAGKHIRVNCVAPGSIYFKGGTWDEAERNNKPLFDSIRQSIPHGRFGTPQEVADLTVYLASDAARWVTGQTVAVDGGQML